MSYLEEVYGRYSAIVGNAVDLATFVQTGLLGDFVTLETVAAAHGRALTSADISYWLYLKPYIAGLPKQRNGQQQADLRVAYFLEYVRTGRTKGRGRPRKPRPPKRNPLKPIVTIPESPRAVIDRVMQSRQPGARPRLTPEQQREVDLYLHYRNNVPQSLADFERLHGNPLRKYGIER